MYSELTQLRQVEAVGQERTSRFQPADEYSEGSGFGGAEYECDLELIYVYANLGN
jgi:hypothetical protein